MGWPPEARAWGRQENCWAWRIKSVGATFSALKRFVIVCARSAVRCRSLPLLETYIHLLFCIS